MRELNNQKRAVLFDLDGTLVDTTDLILRCFEHSWQNVCGRGHSREALIGTFGIPLRDAMRQLMINVSDFKAASEIEDEVELIDRLLAEYRRFNVANHDGMACAFEGVEQVITELRARGYSIGVVTSKNRELAMRGLRLCSSDMIVGKLIDVAVFLEDTNRHKPHPEPVLAALEKLNARPACSAYVGDSSHDMIAGRLAGVQTVAALWGPFPRSELERERPDYLAESISELLEIFP
ncbi:MAG TPA: HAD-IA family hydrolase [Blastocatellia bacterium]|jgi:pyrophosphatase PpaX|nr:HAD-IA family hydrolase [Blastocatellia bacterium]